MTPEERKMHFYNFQEQIKSMQFKSKEELLNHLNSVELMPEEKEELLNLYDETEQLKRGAGNASQMNYQNLMFQVERKIKENGFKTKEELVEYLDNLKKQGVPGNVLTEEKIKEFLELYDKMHPVIDDSLNLEGYKGASLENQNVIVATDKDVVLKTNESQARMPEEFRDVQNEMTAVTSERLANSDEVFEHMRDHKKEEMNLVPISEAINREKLDDEMLKKIRFLITNEYINPYVIQVDVETGVFYNIETDEVLEVRINPETGKYEIFKAGEKVYDNAENQEVMTDTNEEELDREKENVKVRRLEPPKPNPYMGSAAFVKGTLLFVLCIGIALILSIFIILFR